MDTPFSLIDQLGRPLRDLRISVTDRCNFRCVFCMPSSQKYNFLPRQEILSFEEIFRLSKIFCTLGVKKIRLTGGEPLLRSNLEDLISMLDSMEGLEDLALTTNGFFLAKKARILKESGLRRITVSLQSMEDSTFQQIVGSKATVSSILEGIDQAAEVGLWPIKINIVAFKGQNDHTFLDLARHFKEKKYTLRFIEFMDVGNINDWAPEKVLSAREILSLLSQEFSLDPIERDYPGEVALRYRHRDNGAEIGIIASITQPFCKDCSRLRLSSEGKIYTCLFSNQGFDLKKPLREGKSDEEIKDMIIQIWKNRKDRYSEERAEILKKEEKNPPSSRIEMFHLGG